jgi:hypothetical protein
VQQRYCVGGHEDAGRRGRADGGRCARRSRTPRGVDATTARETIVAGIGGFATGRFATAEEVATLVVMLASTRTGNVANDVIDGGLIKTI